MQNMNKIFPWIIVIVFALLLAKNVQGGSRIIEDKFSPQLQIGGRKPELGSNSSDNTQITTLSMFTSARFPVSRNFFLDAQIPFSYYELQTSYYTDREFTVGNPYIGLEKLFEYLPISAYVGIYLPLAPGENGKNNQASNMGFMSNYIDGAEFFTADRIPVYGGVCYYKIFSDFLFTTRTGVSLWIHYKENQKLNSFFLYNLQLGYVYQSLTLIAFWDGRAIFHEQHKYFDENIYNQIGLEAKLTWSNYQPSIFAVKPITYSYLDSINTFVGVKLAVFIRK